MAYGLIDNPDPFMAGWVVLLARRNKLREAWDVRHESNVNAWLRLLDDMRGCSYSRLVAYAWFERVRRGEDI